MAGSHQVGNNHSLLSSIFKLSCDMPAFRSKNGHLTSIYDVRSAFSDSVSSVNFFVKSDSLFSQSQFLNIRMFCLYYHIVKVKYSGFVIWDKFYVVYQSIPYKRALPYVHKPKKLEICPCASSGLPKALVAGSLKSHFTDGLVYFNYYKTQKLIYFAHLI